MQPPALTWQWHLDRPSGEVAPWLEVAGDWAEQSMPPEVWLPAAGHLPGQGEVRVDLQALQGWDARLAACLWEVAHRLKAQGRTVRWVGLGEGAHADAHAGLRDVLDLALQDSATGPEPTTGAPIRGAAAAPVTRPSRAFTHPVLVTLAFIGEVVMALARLLRGRSDLRWGDVLRQVDEAGPLSLPIVVLTCALVGLMLAYMGGSQLASIGAPDYISAVVTVGMVRELAGLMTGVMLAGRVGSAHAAALASMKTGEEIDALQALGVETTSYLVLPRLFALLLVAPALYAFGALAGVVAGLPAAVWAYGLPAGEYLDGCRTALSWSDLWVGLLKCELYALLIALAGCREGLQAGRSAQAVGEATTKAVVKAMVWIVAAACASTVVIQSLGF